MKTKKSSEGVKRPINLTKTLFIVLIFVLGFVVGLLVLQMSIKTVVQPVGVVKVPETNTPTPSVTPTPQPSEEVDPSPITGEKYFPSVDTRRATLTVQWETARYVAKDEFTQLLDKQSGSIDPKVIEKFVASYPNTTDEQRLYILDLWSMGKVTSGGDAGRRIFLLREYGQGMGERDKYTYLLDGASGLVLVAATSSPYEPYEQAADGFWPFSAYLTHFPNLTIKEESMPASLRLENGNVITLQKASTAGFGYDEPKYRFIAEQSTGVQFIKVARSTDGHDVFQRQQVLTEGYPVGKPLKIEEGCLYVFAANGRITLYKSMIPGKINSGGSLGSAFIPEIRWTEGKMNVDAYEVQRLSGCGSHDCSYIVDASVVGPEESLTIVGKTLSGQSVYAPKDPKDHQIVKEVYDGWYVPNGKKADIDGFLKVYPRPVLFWKDAVGRWIRMQSQDLIPPTECGKPVIYLYPEQTTPVSVKLPSFIDVTVSEPAYPSAGWKVIAHPDGSLEYGDGKTYGSLFWEGTGVGYETPKEGFIIKDGEVDQRLTEILAQYGLNETESREFREFWIPEMTGAPYYRVSFLTSEWSKAAPLFVSPRPTTSIRIFMDWQKLNAPISIPEPTIVTPERNGFTLVEWGGLLR